MVIQVDTPVAGITRLVVKFLCGILYKFELVGVRAKTSINWDYGCKYIPFVMPSKVIELVETLGRIVNTLFWVGKIKHVLPPDYTHYNGIIVL